MMSIYDTNLTNAPFFWLCCSFYSSNMEEHLYKDAESLKYLTETNIADTDFKDCDPNIHDWIIFCMHLQYQKGVTVFFYP